jgi:formylglycine-generating enzyme required for sulfatase activity
LTGVLLITALLLSGCTRDEVFSAVATAVSDLQVTRSAEQTRESSPATGTAVSSIDSDDTATLPAAVTSVGNEPTAVQATSAAVATTVVPAAATTTPTTLPTIAPSATATETPTPAPTDTPTPTPLPGLIEQEEAMLLLVPAGPFEMGVDAAALLAECTLFRDGCQESWFSASAPPHTLTLEAYYMDATEVTNRAYVTFLNSFAGQEPTCLEQSCFNPASSLISSGSETAYQVAEETADYPVTGVSWYGAAAYCAWRGGRLPTEAEWEKAASWNPETESKSLYPWGDSFDGSIVNSCDADCQQPQANTDFNDGFAEEAPVASFDDGRSPNGLYDMGGNVWEWVADWFDAAHYSGPNANNLSGPAEGQDKVVRGGSWFDTGNFAATAIRFPSPPANTDASIGFRCAVSP